MVAALNGQKASVSALLAGKANPDIQDDRDETALMKAAFKNYVDVVSTLLKHGADTTLVDIDKVGAAGHGSAEVQAMIIANQLNIFKRKPKSGSYPSPDEGSSRRRRNQHKDTPQGRRGS